VPEYANPTVESTLITVEFFDIESITFVVPVNSKLLIKEGDFNEKATFLGLNQNIQVGFFNIWQHT
jgi:hypothetical protein